MFKSLPKLESYLSQVKNKKHRIALTKLRVSGQKLIIEACLFQSFIKRRFSCTAFCACANFVNINISCFYADITLAKDDLS